MHICFVDQHTKQRLARQMLLNIGKGGSDASVCAWEQAQQDPAKSPNVEIVLQLLPQSRVLYHLLLVTTRRWEMREFEKAVTSWERRRYLELI